jgi:hypothetical protein
MERVWHRRLRWRMRGAWQWPAFAGLTFADAVLLRELPIAGEGPGWVAALLLAMFFNLVAVAAAGPLLGLALRRWRPDLPRVIAADRGGTAALVVVVAILVGVGIGHRGQLRATHDAFLAQSLAVRAYVAHTADVPPVYRRNIARADSISLGDDLYRTCVPSDRPDRALCLIVDVSISPPGLRRDSSAPNATFVPFGQP